MRSCSDDMVWAGSGKFLLHATHSQFTPSAAFNYAAECALHKLPFLVEVLF